MVAITNVNTVVVLSVALGIAGSAQGAPLNESPSPDPADKHMAPGVEALLGRTVDSQGASGDLADLIRLNPEFSGVVARAMQTRASPSFGGKDKRLSFDHSIPVEDLDPMTRDKMKRSSFVPAILNRQDPDKSKRLSFDHSILAEDLDPASQDWVRQVRRRGVVADTLGRIEKGVDAVAIGK